ncbi:hypothetical protein STEG23_023576 [Scotinomys teguina]
MGVGQSHPIVTALKELLKTTGVKVKPKHLQSFLDAVYRCAPWFLVSGSLTRTSWKKLGRDLNVAQEEGRLTTGVLPIWALVKECLEAETAEEEMENGAKELAKLQEERSEKSEKGSHCKEQGTCGGGSLYLPLPSLEDQCLASTDAKESESNSEAEPEEEPARRNQCERDKSRRRKSSEGERYHEPLDFKVIKSLAESVRTYGITASFTLAQVEALSRHCMIPNDWSGLADAFLIEFAGEEAGANQAAVDKSLYDKQNAVTYEDVHVDFTLEEWSLLDTSQRNLYKDVMLETYSNLTNIGKTEFFFRIDKDTVGNTTILKNIVKGLKDMKDINIQQCIECCKAFTHANYPFRLREKSSISSQCVKALAYPSTLQMHEKTHTGEKPYGCNQYDKVFSRHRHLLVHERPHTEKLYACNQCGKVFACYKSLQRHKRTHTAEKPYECNQCGKAFAYHQSLQMHKRSHTGEKPYECNQCGKVFACYKSLQMHKRTHTGDKPYECNQCGKAFAYHQSLEMHKRSHTGEKPYECKQCDKAFACHKYLHIHKRTHTGEKPYECNQCGKAFAYHQSLQMHKRSHTGEKPYECNQCGKAFACYKRLQMHRRTHTGEKPY